MKYIKLIIAAVIFSNIGFTQSDYFPLEIGNYWNYEYMYNYPINYQNEVVDTVTFGENRYFKVESELNNRTYYYRVDTTEKLYKYNFNTSSDVLIADFQMETGDSVIVFTYDDTLHTYMHCTSTQGTLITTPTTSDTFYNCYSFYFDIPQVYDDEYATWYSENIGFIHEVYLGPQPVFHTIIGAYVGGENVLKNSEVELFPIDYNILSIYPNPFNNSATINISIPFELNLIIHLYDLLGKEVLTIIDKNFKPGKYQVGIDSENLSSGVYIVKAISNNYIESKKIVLLK